MRKLTQRSKGSDVHHTSRANTSSEFSKIERFRPHPTNRESDLPAGTDTRGWNAIGYSLAEGGQLRRITTYRGHLGADALATAADAANVYLRGTSKHRRSHGSKSTNTRQRRSSAAANRQARSKAHAPGLPNTHRPAE